jgi:hypothetical protein
MPKQLASPSIKSAKQSKPVLSEMKFTLTYGGHPPFRLLVDAKYYVTFTDDHLCYTNLELLKSKDETLQGYKTFAAWAQTQCDRKIRRLRSDRGGGYTSGNFTKFLQEQGTECRLTMHNTPQHNGVAESLN